MVVMKIQNSLVDLTARQAGQERGLGTKSIDLQPRNSKSSFLQERPFTCQRHSPVTRLGFICISPLQLDPDAISWTKNQLSC